MNSEQIWGTLCALGMVLCTGLIARECNYTHAYRMERLKRECPKLYQAKEAADAR